MNSSALGHIEFGGPDLPARRLRDLLQQQVDDAPSGSRIDWCTYYFRDRALAKSLICASDRGVAIRLVVESDPRRKGANDPVIALLKGHGLGGGFRLYRPAPFDRGHLHAKIYAFSHPEIAWIGSFNPSGDEPEDEDVVAEIGNQDRGHNLLLGVERPELVDALRRHVGLLASWSPLPLKWRLHPSRFLENGNNQLQFYPRFRPFLVEREVERLGAGDRFHGAISHLKKGELTNQLARAAARGAAIDLLVHDTERRVPSALVQKLLASGIGIVRVCHPDGLPMHAKFLLIDRNGERSAWLGSHNFNRMSLRLNAEILLRTTDEQIIETLDRRFGEIAAMA